jgi:hypothetical protein
VLRSIITSVESDMYFFPFYGAMSTCFHIILMKIVFYYTNRIFTVILSSLYSLVVVHIDGVRLSLNSGHQRAYCSSPRWYMSMESYGGMISTGENQRTLRKTCPSATLPTKNPTWTDPVAKPGFRGLEAFCRMKCFVHILILI